MGCNPTVIAGRLLKIGCSVGVTGLEMELVIVSVLAGISSLHYGSQRISAGLDNGSSDGSPRSRRLNDGVPVQRQ